MRIQFEFENAIQAGVWFGVPSAAIVFIVAYFVVRWCR